MRPETQLERNVGMFTGTGRCRPVAFLGRGSTGLVYRVHDNETKTDVALKTLGTLDPLSCTG